ncbi:hypothetical protein SAMN02983003_1346 [Devosia enhydra]|uniref:Uncharacterized protein n=1 Tax=Devosia enhydra TaxID=665118 RepID=A0A1K2HVP6_9HYPH|nr:hypothetical protein [Devosia enhydra]SFZ82912.1 hypothetical protein SAMN02983003_1346 [Devosia enhydra]
MKLNPKITSALAWTGLIVVVAVPSVEMFNGGQGERSMSAQPQAVPSTAIPVVPRSEATTAAVPAAATGRPVLEIDRAPAAATVDPVRTASTNAAPANSSDPVDRFVSGGKALPSYISDGGTAAPAKPAVPRTTPPAAANTIPILPSAPTGSVPAAGATTQVAAVDARQAVPYPLPRDLRPANRPDLAGVQTAALPSYPPAYPTTAATPGPIAPSRPADAPLIIDEASIGQPVRPAPSNEGRIITQDDLAGWQSGSLADYLASRGLLAEDEPAPRYQTPRRPLPPADVGDSRDYVPGGFWLSDSPYSRW